jgi:exosortase A
MSLPWRTAWMVFAVSVVVLVLAYRETWSEMLVLWIETESYTHGPIIPLISAWLVWRIRNQTMASTDPRFSIRGLIALAAFCGLWALGDILQVSFARHFAVMLILIGAFWTIFGDAVFKKLFFPITFLLFAVPFGDFLTVPMMEQTADFTVAALQWTGIPVYREARLLQIPSGNWSVVEACSGTRYLIASVMLGALFAYLFYRSWQKRALFVLASIAVPVLGNWLRAYLLVMIGHLTQNKYGVGADHILFGWAFFGVLIYIMFTIGARWREDVDIEEKAASKPVATGKAEPRFRWQPAVAAMLVAAVVPLLVTVAYSSPVDAKPPSSLAIDGWLDTPLPATPWQPAVSGSRVQALAAFRSPTFSRNGVTLYRAVFSGQRGSARMIRFGNEFLPAEFVGDSSNKERDLVLRQGEGQHRAREIEVRELTQKRVVRGAYVVQGRAFASPYFAKLALARAQLTGRGDVGMIVVWAAAGADASDARAALDAFEAAAGTALLTIQ